MGMALPAHPRVEPDPFDKEVERLLADPAIRADLDAQHAAFERGELTTYSHAEVRERLRKLGVPILDETVADA